MVEGIGLIPIWPPLVVLECVCCGCVCGPSNRRIPTQMQQERKPKDCHKQRRRQDNNQVNNNRAQQENNNKEAT